jgi:hypothetical protein
LRRVDAIKGQTSKGVRLTAPVDRRLVIEDALMACCPPGKWISVDDLFRQMKVEGHRFEVAGDPWKLYLVDANYGSLGYDGYGGFEVLEARYVLAYLFEYLATLGLIDVAYSLPYAARADYTDRWGADELVFLSRYDGLRYLRLNALGAYCLGLAETYAPRARATAAVRGWRIDLTLTCSAPRSPPSNCCWSRSPTEQSLIAGAWMRTRSSPAADADERERIRRFLEDSADGALPAGAARSAGGVEQRATALTDAGPARLIQCRDVALANLLAPTPPPPPTAPAPASASSACRTKKLAAFRKGLGKLGFVLPEVAHDARRGRRVRAAR